MIKTQSQCSYCKFYFLSTGNYCPHCGQSRGPGTSEVSTQNNSALWKPIVKWGCVFLFGGLFILFFQNLFFKLISLAASVLFAVSLVVMVFTIKKQQQVSTRALISSILISFFCLVLFKWLAHMPFKMSGFIIALLMGAMIGTGISLLTAIWMKNKVVFMKQSYSYLIIWGGFFLLNQWIVTFTGRSSRLAFFALIISTGIMIGYNGANFVRVKKLARY